MDPVSETLNKTCHIQIDVSTMLSWRRPKEAVIRVAMLSQLVVKSDILKLGQVFGKRYFHFLYFHDLNCRRDSLFPGCDYSIVHRKNEVFQKVFKCPWIIRKTKKRWLVSTNYFMSDGGGEKLPLKGTQGF